MSTRGTQSVWPGLDGGSRALDVAWKTLSVDSAGVMLTLGLGVSTNSACGMSSVLAGALFFASRSMTFTSPNSVTLSDLSNTQFQNGLTFLEIG